jgi:hypothetical protein
MKAVRPLRAMTPVEARAVPRTAKATRERVDVVKRARALLAVRAGQTYTQAAREARYTSGDSVSQLVERFNQQGLAALPIADGRGRTAHYILAQRERIVAKLQRVPDRRDDATATWSLKTRARALRQAGLPQLSTSTIRGCCTRRGIALARRAPGVPPAPPSASGLVGPSRSRTPRPGGKPLIASAYAEAEAGGVALWCQDEAGPEQTIP